MKKTLSLVLAVVTVILTVPMTATTVSAETDGYYTYEISDGCAAITGVDQFISGDITIPATLRGYPVTNIGDGVLFECTSLTSVTIPDSVTGIGDRAFAYCTSLTSVTIGNSVTSIGDEAFYFCTSLTSVTIGNSVTSIGKGAFWNCADLTSVAIPGSVTSIDKSAFYYCYAITNVYYAGSKDEWNSIGIGSNNSALISPPYFHYNAPDPETHYVYTVIEAPGCDENGKSAYVCPCGYSKDEDIIPATGHTYANGVCTVCGEKDPTAIIYGDANGDGKVNLSDVSALLKYIAKWDIEIDTKAADVNRDEKINLSDVSLILKYIAKWDVTLG